MTENRGEIMAYTICTFPPLDIKASRFFSFSEKSEEENPLLFTTLMVLSLLTKD